MKALRLAALFAAGFLLLNAFVFNEYRNLPGTWPLATKAEKVYLASEPRLSPVPVELHPRSRVPAEEIAELRKVVYFRREWIGIVDHVAEFIVGALALVLGASVTALCWGGFWWLN